MIHQVEAEAVSARSLADGIAGMGPVRSGPESGGLRLHDGQHVYPTPRFARQV